VNQERPSCIKKARAIALAALGAVALATGLLISINQTTVQAQGTADDTISQEACRRTNCMVVFSCTETVGGWGTEEAVWVEVLVIPQAYGGARPRELVWEEASGEFQPFQFTVEWKNSGAGVNKETVTIDDSGADVGASHPNIRYHTSSAVLCDDFTPRGPSQQPGGSGECIEAIRYNFDIRLEHDGTTGDCYSTSYGIASGENADLDAVPVASCDTSATPWTYRTQKRTNLECFENEYYVRYDSP
jgi:hypothetical protein